MNVYRYETPERDIVDLKGPMVFLGGPTARGNQLHLMSWRFEATEEFKRQGFDGNLIIPEFTDRKEPDKDKDWIPIWENTGLVYSDCIMFWIPKTRELIGLTTNFEIGYWLAREPAKLVYGRPDTAYRMRYVDIMWNHVWKDMACDTSIYDSLTDTVAASIAKANNKYYGKP